MTERGAASISRSGNGAARLRYRRLCAAGSALAVTMVSMLGGIGVLGQASSAGRAGQGPPSAGAAEGAALTSADTIPDTTRAPLPPVPGTAAQETTAPLPAGSGTGRRVVFDISEQRVWLVDPGASGGPVVSTYLVSGSVTDNLHAGTYAVYSRSRHAVGIDDSGEMQFFVRFTRGANAAIGFHSIPTKDGQRLQTRTQLGTPQSHGCIRQALPDAKRLWAFAPVGRKVVVTD